MSEIPVPDWLKGYDVGPVKRPDPETGEPNWEPPVRGRPATLRTGMTALQQEEAFSAHVDEATEWIRQWINDPCRLQVTRRLAAARLVRGIDHFGDAGWRKSSDELMVDTQEELADALVYLAMRAYRRRGGPGSR